MQSRAGDGPAHHGGFEFGELRLVLAQSFLEELAKDGLHAGFNKGLKLPLVLLASRRRFGQKVARGQN